MDHDLDFDQISLAKRPPEMIETGGIIPQQ